MLLIRPSLPQGDPVGPALTEAEFRMASGAFDPAKFEEYNRQVGGALWQLCYNAFLRRSGPAQPAMTCSCGCRGAARP